MNLEHEENEDKIKLMQDKIGNIYFTNVAFRYSTKLPVFTDFNLTIPKGKITAIVGESGSGKSTLISLIQNLYPKISIGNFDLKYLQNES